ncbi:hypothetical protein STEG23_007604, partial [Scotinomys teguina]
ISSLSSLNDIYHIHQGYFKESLVAVCCLVGNSSGILIVVAFGNFRQNVFLDIGN